MFLVLVILAMVLEISYLLGFYKKYHLPRLRYINEGIMIFVFSICYVQFAFEHTFRLSSAIFILVTILLLTSLSFALIGIFEYQFGMLIFTLVNALTYIGSSIKMNTTGVPVMWMDFHSGLFWDVVWNMYLKQDYPYVIMVVIVLAGILYLLYKRSAFVLNFQVRLRRTLLGVIGFSIILLLVGKVFINKVHSTTFNEQGSLVYFISSKKVDAMSSSGISGQYSKTKMEEIIQKYQKEFSVKKTSDNDNETVITILSESLADPESFSGVKWKEDPMPNFRKLQTESGGDMQSPMFGGGTTNVEFSVLTGFSYTFFNQQINAFDYLSQNPSRTQSIAQYKEESIAVHTHLKSGYHRSTVLPNLGFSKFIGREDIIKSENSNKNVYYTEGYLSDYTLFSQILDEIEGTSQTNLLVHGLSMQNHYPYTVEAKGSLASKDILIEGDHLNDEQKQLALYARGVKKTDEALGMLIENLEKMDRNVTVIMYGDHYPALNGSVYEKYPIKDANNKLINDHSTPYFVWKNHNRKSENVTDSLTPEGLSVLAMEEGNSELPIFYQFVKKVENSVDIKNYADTKKLTKQQQEMVKDYELIQYDMLVGNQYSKVLFKK